MSNYPSNFLLYNQKSVKQLSVVVKIEGLSTVLSSVPISTKIRYGDSIVYGQSGLVYGGLIPYQDAQGNLLYKTLLDVSSSSMSITQRLEPEQGRGAVSTLSLSFVDLNQYMTQLISPGVLLDDIMGKSVSVYLGYQELSYPEDYVVIFRGRVSDTQSQSGRIIMQLSDPNIIRRQNIFFSGKTVLSAAISNSDTTIPVVSNGDFYQQILGPSGTYDSAIKTYVKIGDEFIEYPATGYGSNQFTGVTRGARGTTAVAANAGDAIEGWIEIEDHAIDMMLKLMLSGWAGPYSSNNSILNFVRTGDATLGDLSSAVILPNSTDADIDLGISEGDYVSFTGSLIPGNNQTAKVLQLVSANGFSNNVIVTDKVFTLELNSPAVMAIRSQYDVYPKTAGSQLPGSEVDVAGIKLLKSTYLASDENNMRFLLNDSESAKTFIESELLLPLACYSITRFGRISAKITKAPIATEQLQILNKNSVKTPENIKMQRGLNNRKFFNEVDWYFNYTDAGSYSKVVRTFDSTSLNVIGIGTLLPIKSRGIKSDLGTEQLIQRRTDFLLQRYKNGAVMLDISVNWEVGVLIESGDIVAVEDGGVLQISNVNTGVRNFGTQLMEVIDRQLDIKNGAVTLKLVSGVGSEVTDRYGTISPSSVLTSGSLSSIVIQDSYGALYPGQEWRKWEDYAGLPILIHSEDYSFEATATFSALDPSNPFKMLISNYSPSGTPPSAGMIVDIARYPTTVNPYDNSLYKQIHAFFDPQVAATGIDNFNFMVSSGEIGKFNVGLPVILHDEQWNSVSAERNISGVDTIGNIVTVSGALNYSPASGCLVDLIGFADQGGPFRFA